MRRLDASHFEVPPEPEILDEIERAHVPVDRLVDEAVGYLEKGETEELALARMFIERGHSEDLSHWLVREANTRHAASTER